MIINYLLIQYLMMKRKQMILVKKSMKRGFEHKVLEYNKKNYDRYWNEKEKIKLMQ